MIRHRLTVILGCFAALALAQSAQAQDAKNIGAGFVLGDTMGGTAKFWIDRLSALDIGMGADSNHGNFTFYADYLYHGWKALPQPKQGKLAAYVGGGPRIEDRSDKTEFGIRGVVGASYWLPSNPVEIFSELGPMIRMTPDGGVYLIGGVGARFYFKTWN